MKDFAAIILAGGTGERFGSDKMGVKVIGRLYPWQIVYERLAPLTRNIIVVGQDIPGGITRRDSVFAGLATIPDEFERVIIAEGARFLVTTDQYAQVLHTKGDAVAFGSPSVNTQFSFHLNEPITRINCIEVHTPQAFSAPFLRRLLSSHGRHWEADEWSLACHFHRSQCTYLPGDRSTQLKLTYDRDLMLMEEIYARQ